MRIGLLAYGMHGHVTGIGHYVTELARGFQRWHRDVEVVLLIPGRGPVPALAAEFASVRLPGVGRLPSIVTVGPAVLDRVARRLHLQIVHDPCGIAPFVWPRSRLYRRVVTVHDVIPLLHPEWYPLADRMLFRTTLSWARWTADAVLTVSRTSRRDIIHHLHMDEDRVHVTPNGVDHPADRDRIQLQSDERWQRWRPYFLMAGDLSPRKNAPLLLRAFAELRRDHPETTLLLAGPGKSGVVAAAGVHHLGYVSREDLASLYANAQAVVFPSLYEGFGFPALEAMAYGTAVICSAAGSLPEVTGGAAVLVDPHDRAGWAIAMGQMLSDPSHRRHLICAGLARAREFTWAKTCRQTHQVYTDLAQTLSGSRTQTALRLHDAWRPPSVPPQDGGRGMEAGRSRTR